MTDTKDILQGKWHEVKGGVKKQCASSPTTISPLCTDARKSCPVLFRSDTATTRPKPTSRFTIG